MKLQVNTPNISNLQLTIQNVLLMIVSENYLLVHTPKSTEYKISWNILTAKLAAAESHQLNFFMFNVEKILVILNDNEMHKNCAIFSLCIMYRLARDIMSPSTVLPDCSSPVGGADELLNYELVNITAVVSLWRLSPSRHWFTEE